MGPAVVDASNSSLPHTHPVVVLIPGVPSCCRGERCAVDARVGRLSSGQSVLTYCSGKNVVVRNLDGAVLLPNTKSKLDVLVYRGHGYNATSVKVSPSGAWVASGDERGKMRIWAYDHEEHLCKYECHGLSGPIRDIDWDFESKRIVYGGERDGAGNAPCALAIQWDTGVSVGQLGLHLKGRATSVAFKPSRPFKLVTAGKDDHKTFFHKGPPFARVPVEGGVPEENGHSKGSVFCVRYNSSGTLAVSVGTDRCICCYEGKEFKLLSKLENVHTASIYCVDWSGDDKAIITASGDGTCKLFTVSDDGTMKEKGVWCPAQNQLGKSFEKVPVGGNQVACAFVNGVTPVSVGLNGQISILPKVPANADGIKVLTGHYAPIAGMAVDFASKRFYTGDTDGIMCEWDLMTGQAVGRLTPPEGNDDLMFVIHGGAISGLAFASKSGLLYSVGWDDKVFITQKSKVQMGPLSLGAQPTNIGAGGEVAVVCTVQGLQLVREKSLGEMLTTSYHPQVACVTKNDKTVYVGGDDCKIHIYSVDGMTLKETGIIEDGHLKPIYSLALSNDGSKLASGDMRDVCVFDLKDDNKPIVGKGRWCFHAMRITSLSWSNDDKYIASGSLDDSIYLWSLEKLGRRIHYQYAHRGGITGLEFLPTSGGSYKLASVGVDDCVNQWDVTEGVKEKFLS